MAPHGVEAIQYLIEELEMNVNETGLFGRNCFLQAAEGGKIETMRYLNLVNPELKNDRDDDENTALSLAASHADLETVEFLVEEMEINVNETGKLGRNSFLFAAEHNKIEIMKYLDSK